eukprot:1163563-Prymnesium_polylepis.1
MRVQEVAVWRKSASFQREQHLDQTSEPAGALGVTHRTFDRPDEQRRLIRSFAPKQWQRSANVGECLRLYLIPRACASGVAFDVCDARTITDVRSCHRYDPLIQRLLRAHTRRADACAAAAHCVVAQNFGARRHALGLKLRRTR